VFGQAARQRAGCRLRRSVSRRSSAMRMGSSGTQARFDPYSEPTSTTDYLVKKASLRELPPNANGRRPVTPRAIRRDAALSTTHGAGATSPPKEAPVLVAISSPVDGEESPLEQGPGVVTPLAAEQPAPRAAQRAPIPPGDRRVPSCDPFLVRREGRAPSSSRFSARQGDPKLARVENVQPRPWRSSAHLRLPSTPSCKKASHALMHIVTTEGRGLGGHLPAMSSFGGPFRRDPWGRGSANRL
jgi:hypothetical protein